MDQWLDANLQTSDINNNNRLYLLIMATISVANGSDDVEQPASKRTKIGDLLDILSPHVFADEDSLRAEYASATPYPHGRITHMFVDGFLEQVLEEVKQNSKVKFKESDLFRVYQSVDLGNLNSDSDDTKSMPSLMQLKQAIYSPQYRAFVERLIGLPPETLTEQVDCAANCHSPGCHLLCHDDVIGNRKVSFIIYLTDKEWTREDGGCLELYPSSNNREPEVNPSKTIVPDFNSMAFFQVLPGVSFHAVQEVFGDRPRLSLQGWYHSKDSPAQIEDATLSRLKTMGKGEDTEGTFSSVEWKDTTETILSKEDFDALSQYINSTYLSQQSIDEIRKRFEEDSSVQLRQFIKDDWIEKLKAAMSTEKDLGNGEPTKDYSFGVDDCWKAVGPAHKQRFLEYSGDKEDNDSVGAILQHLRTNVFQSEVFGRFLKLITSLGLPLGYRGRVRRFRPGLDYTVAHYGILTTKAVLDATLCFAAGNGDQSRVDEETGDLIGSGEDALWASGDVGGFECYIAADDEENEAAAQYDEDDDTELLSVDVSNNTLSFVYRDPGTMRFVKYVGCRAPSSRWDVSMEYEVADDEEQEDVAASDDADEGSKDDSET